MLVLGEGLRALQSFTQPDPIVLPALFQLAFPPKAPSTHKEDPASLRLFRSRSQMSLPFCSSWTENLSPWMATSGLGTIPNVELQWPKNHPGYSCSSSGSQGPPGLNSQLLLLPPSFL